VWTTPGQVDPEVGPGSIGRTSYGVAHAAVHLLGARSLLDF